MPQNDKKMHKVCQTNDLQYMIQVWLSTSNNDFHTQMWMGGGHRESGKQHVWVLVSTDRAVAGAIAQQHSCTTNSSDCERKKVLLQAALTAAAHFWMYQRNPRGPVSPVVTLCTQVTPCVSTEVETNELACKQIDLHI